MKILGGNHLSPLKSYLSASIFRQLMRGGSSEGLMAFNGCSLAEVNGALPFGGEGELCCQGNQIGNILGNWKRTTSGVTSGVTRCRCLLRLCFHLQRWTSDFAWCLTRGAPCHIQSFSLGKALAGVPAAVDQAPRWINDGPFMIWKKSRDARFLLMFFETGQYFGFEWCLENVS